MYQHCPNPFSIKQRRKSIDFSPKRFFWGRRNNFSVHFLLVTCNVCTQAIPELFAHNMVIRLLANLRNLARSNRREQTRLTPIFKTYFYTIAPEINPVSKIIVGDKTWPLYHASAETLLKLYRPLCRPGRGARCARVHSLT